MTSAVLAASLTRRRPGFRDPLLVSATDGVGTKAEIARLTGRLDTIGRDLVAMCVDDLVCAGATPLFFLDYLAIGHLDPEAVECLIAGIAAGCAEAGCALIGGEMAEHPGVMEADQFDLVGFAVGAVERGRLLDGSAVVAGDLLVALDSPNLRSNGFSLARHLVFDVAGRSLDDFGLGGGRPDAGRRASRSQCYLRPGGGRHPGRPRGPCRGPRDRRGPAWESPPGAG